MQAPPKVPLEGETRASRVCRDRQRAQALGADGGGKNAGIDLVGKPGRQPQRKPFPKPEGLTNYTKVEYTRL